MIFLFISIYINIKRVFQIDADYTVTLLVKP